MAVNSPKEERSTSFEERIQERMLLPEPNVFTVVSENIEHGCPRGNV